MTIVILIVFLSLSCGVMAAAKTVNKEELVQMQRSGLSCETIVAAVEASGLSFDLDAGALIQLRGAGMPDDLLKSILQASGRAKGTQRDYDQSIAWEKLAPDASFDLPVKMMFREFEGALKDLL